MTSYPPQHACEPASNLARGQAAKFEPRTLRTYTPTQAVLAGSAGVFLWTPEGRRLYDFTSGVLVSNLGHNPRSWMTRFGANMGWQPGEGQEARGEGREERNEPPPSPHAPHSSPLFLTGLPFNAYNAVTPVETETIRRLIELLQDSPGGRRLEQVFWAASGSEAIQKALWAALARDPERDMILATRHGFHGKKGLAGAVTGCETDHDRDPRVRFISFPRAERADLSQRGQPFDATVYKQELEALYREFGQRLGTLITEPYLGGGGSYHPPHEYLQILQAFCREHDLIFILDEVQSNFGRTGSLFAFEKYGLEPDVIVLGKGLGNGVPVAAAVGRADLFARLEYGEGSDTWSANPLSCAAVLATLDEFATKDILGQCRRSSAVLEKGLVRLKELPFIAHVRGEQGGMVWGIETRDHAGRQAADWANEVVRLCYLGKKDGGIHLLGPLAQKVIRIAPPLVITEEEAGAATELMYAVLSV